MKVKVRNMLSSNGNTVPNQFIICVGKDIYFQSYETVIAKESPNGTILDSGALNYSVTTSKYLYNFLGLSRKEIIQKIKDKEIKLKNLNK